VLICANFGGEEDAVDMAHGLRCDSSGSGGLLDVVAKVEGS